MNTLYDSSILRTLGVMLARDEHRTARPVPVDSSFVVFRRCSWCGVGLGCKPADEVSAGLFTDTICPACMARVKADLDQRRAAA
jgi:hypothetical protein